MEAAKLHQMIQRSLIVKYVIRFFIIMYSLQVQHKKLFGYFHFLQLWKI